MNEPQTQIIDRICKLEERVEFLETKYNLFCNSKIEIDPKAISRVLYEAIRGKLLENPFVNKEKVEE